MVAREPKAKAMSPMMTAAWVMGSVLFWRRISSPANEKQEEKLPRAQVGVLLKRLCKKKGSRDSVDGYSNGNGNGTSMVLGEGKKPSGEEVSFSLLLLLY
jgi:hypothetical protein